VTTPPVGLAWPGNQALVTESFDPSFDLDECLGQRQATFRFALTDGVTGMELGDLHPIRPASLTHDTARGIKRQLSFALTASETAAINTLTERVSPFMVIPGAPQEYPLGRYMFVDESRAVYTSGRLGAEALYDEMFLVDQEILLGISGFGRSVVDVILEAVQDLPITLGMEASPFISADAWGVGTNRGQILETLSVAGDYWSPWFGNDGLLRFQRTFDPALRVPDIDLDRWSRVIQASIVETDNLLTAPNVFVVISNSAADPDVAVVGTASVPATAPNSVANRGFSIPQTQDLQLSNQAQADAVAEGLAQRQTVFETVTLSTPPDPRHDSYNVIKWQGDLWLELAWSMTLL